MCFTSMDESVTKPTDELHDFPRGGRRENTVALQSICSAARRHHHHPQPEVRQQRKDRVLGKTFSTNSEEKISSQPTSRASCLQSANRPYPWLTTLLVVLAVFSTS